jgi:AmiR/NasT family two-component response regulator
MSSLLTPQHSTTAQTAADELVRLQTENEQLREALASRVVVEQAKGAVSARFGILPQEAFELLRGLSRSQRRPLSEFAAEVVKNRGALDEIADQLTVGSLR